jgi:hypothetical protein
MVERLAVSKLQLFAERRIEKFGDNGETLTIWIWWAIPWELPVGKSAVETRYPDA